MHGAWRETENHCNFMLLSNSSRPIIIEEGDRRFNVPNQQKTRLLFTANEYASLVEQAELPGFAKLMGSWQVNDDLFLKPLTSMSKERIYESTHSLLERIAKALHAGDVKFFWDTRPDELQLRTDHFGKMLPTREYDALLRGMLDDTFTVLKPSDLYVIFRMVTAGDRIFPETRASQRQIFLRFGLLPTDKDVHIDGRTGKSTRGVKAPEWIFSEELERDILTGLSAVSDTGPASADVVPIRKPSSTL
jgi:hypothetical protein